MPGRLLALTRALTTSRSFELIVTPAFADLHHARTRGASRLLVWRLRTGVLRAVVGAVILDVAGDVRVAARAIVTVIPERTYLAIVVSVVAAVFLSMQLWRAPAAAQPLLALYLAPSAAATGVVAGLVAVGRSLARRVRSRRAITTAALLAMVALFTVLDQGVVRANAAFRTTWINAMSTVPRPTTFTAQLEFERSATGGARGRLLPFTASAGAFLLLGVALRRRGAAITFVAAAASLLGYLLLQSPTLGSVPREWLPPAALYAIAVAASVHDARSSRLRFG